MKRLLPTTLRGRLLLLGLLSFAPLAALLGFAYVRVQTLALEEARDDARVLAREAGDEYRTLLERAEAHLFTLARNPVVGGDDPAACGRLLSEAIARLSDYTVLSLIDPSGAVRCSSSPSAIGLDLGDRVYFRRARASGGFEVGEYAVGRVTGATTVGFALPVGEPAAGGPVLAASMSLSALAEETVVAGVGEETEVILFDSTGVVVARHPAGGGAVGDTVAATLLRAARDPASRSGIEGRRGEGANDPRGWAVAPLLLDGRSRGLYAGAVVRPTRFAAILNRLFGFGAAGLVLIVVLAGGGVAFLGHSMIYRRLGALVETARRLRDGELEARTGIVYAGDEIATVAQTFDEMADGLQTRIRELEATKERLAEREALFRDMAENVPAVFWIMSPELDEIVYVSPAYEDVWGRPTAELYENPDAWLDAMIDEDRAQVAQSFEPARLEEGGWQQEYRIRRPDGSVRWIQDRASSVRDDDGGIRRVVGIAEDITDIRKLREQFLHAQKMEAVGRLAAGVAHDFNNLLTVISTRASLLQMDLTENEQGREDVEEIAVAAQRASLLTRQLLGFSRKEEPIPERLDLARIVPETAKMLDRMVGDTVQLRVDTQDRPAPVDADPGHLQQVLMNLAVNARDAMPDSGLLTVQVRSVHLDEKYAHQRLEAETGPYVCLTISDTGVGMDGETRAQIFEPFFTTKPEGEGTGLGLSTVYGIVHQMDGHIAVSSEPGQGTTFKIYLPRAEGSAEEREGWVADEVADVGSDAVPALTVLVVDDEASILSALEEALRRFGHEVVTATGGRDAMEEWERRSTEIDLLITDVMMPDLYGPELVERFRRLDPELPVIFMSGHADESVFRPDLVPRGALFMNKPFTTETLALLVRRVVARWRKGSGPGGPDDA